MIRFSLFSVFFLIFNIHATQSISLSFPLLLQARKISPPTDSKTRQRILETTAKFAARYSMALIVPLPVGTPAQEQKMVLDTGSQLSWVQCEKVKPTQNGGVPPPLSGSFNPTVSSSFSPLSCDAALCKPHVPDFSIPTQCDTKNLCYYSYFYADGTLAEGNLVTEKLALSPSPLILGCSKGSSDDNGILGMNTGRLSVLSQLKITRFSYCVPRNQTAGGTFVIGENPTAKLTYVPLLTYKDAIRMPNLDPFAYTVPMTGIRVGAAMVNVSAEYFRANAGGSGQTILDSGSELTYLVDEAYDKVREEVGKRVGPMMKKGFSYGGVADMCFDGSVAGPASERIGGIGLVLEGAEIVVGRESVLVDVGGGVRCVAIGRSSMMGSAGNIIGNVHQRDLWVEFDVAGGRVGLSRADCSKS